jgi:hypothetical protein
MLHSKDHLHCAKPRKPQKWLYCLPWQAADKAPGISAYINTLHMSCLISTPAAHTGMCIHMFQSLRKGAVKPGGDVTSSCKTRNHLSPVSAGQTPAGRLLRPQQSTYLAGIGPSLPLASC